MGTTRNLRWLGWLAVATLTAGMVAACAGTTSAPGAHSGGVVTFAEDIGLPPNYISPLTPGAYFNGANVP